MKKMIKNVSSEIINPIKSTRFNTQRCKCIQEMVALHRAVATRGQEEKNLALHGTIVTREH